MEVKDIARSDYARKARLSSIAFHMTNGVLASPEEEEKEFDRSFAKSDMTFGINKNKIRRLGTYIGGNLAAAATVLPYTIHFDGQACDMGGIGGVVSDPVIRRQGAVRALLLQAFAEMKAGGQLFSYLQPLSRGFYSKFGYEMSAEKVAWTIPVEFLPKPDSAGIEHYEGDDRQKQEIIALHRRFNQDFNMAIQRDEQLGWDTFFKQIEPYRSDVFSYLHRNSQGVAEGFLAYRFVRNAPDEVVLDVGSAFYFSTARGLSALLAFLATYAYHANFVKIMLPTSIDLNPLLPENKSECKSVKRAIITFGMARVINAAAVLAIARYQGTGSFTVRIADEQCLWNNKLLAVRFGASPAEVREIEDSAAAADLELDIKAFTSLITGRRSIDEAEYLPGVKVNGNLDNLRKAFYKKPVWLEDFF